MDNNTIAKQDIECTLSEKERKIREDLHALYLEALVQNVNREYNRAQIAAFSQIINTSFEDFVNYILTSRFNKEIFVAALKDSNIEIVDIFLNNDLFCEIFKNDNSFIYSAIIRNDISIVEKLKDARFSYSSDLLLSYCSNCKEIKISTIEFLIEKLGQDVNKTYGDSSVENPITALVIKLEYEAVKYLISKGANINLSSGSSGFYGTANLLDRLKIACERNVNLYEEKKNAANKIFNLLFKSGVPLKIENLSFNYLP